MNILNYIPEGRENAITREQLSTMTGKHDRINRKLIEIERKNGATILSTEKGYYRTDDIAEIDRFLHSIDSRMTSMYFTFLAMRRMVAQAEGRKIVRVRQHFRRLGIGTKELDGQEKIG